MLECLKDIWGESILISRDNIYRLVSGDISDSDGNQLPNSDDIYRRLICCYYRTHASFSNYVHSIYYFGDGSMPFITRFVKETRNVINKYKQYVEDIVYTYHGSKFLLEDKEYRYYAVNPVCDLSKLRGVIYIK